MKEVRWEKPPDGWSKLNTDGSVLGSMGIAGCGGIVRNNQGGWVVGFSRHIGLSNYIYLVTDRQHIFHPKEDMYCPSQESFNSTTGNMHLAALEQLKK